MGLSFALSVRGASGGDHRFLAGGASGSWPTRSPGARSQAFLCQYCPRTWRNRADHRPVAGARASGDHAQIHKLRRCGGPRGGRCRLVRPAKGLSHGKEDQSDRYEDRQAQSQGCRVHSLGHPPCRVRGPDQAVGAEELRVSPPRGGPIPEVNAWASRDSGASMKPGTSALRSGAAGSRWIK